MITLPLVWLVSALTTIAALVVSQDARAPLIARVFLCVFLLALATIGLLLGVRLSFDGTWAARLQPLVAVMIAPSAYLGFYALTHLQDGMWRRTLLLNGVPIVLAQVAILANSTISADAFVLSVTSVYLFRLAQLLPCNTETFVHVASHALRIVRSGLYATMALLGLMVASDLLIVAASVFAGDAVALKLLSGLSGVFAAVIFVLALAGAPMAVRASKETLTKHDKPTEKDQTMRTALDALMQDTQIYTDSNLTLARVARRLSVPVRDVSTAINRTADENFSRYINGYRVRHAQEALRRTDLAITEVMFDAGFVSKSSFNTEFRRITGQTPSQYRASGAST